MKKKLISIVLPCLNEEKTLPRCIREIKKAFKNLPQSSEIIVVDNNSTDNSYKIAKKLKARTFLETKRGYGRALNTGILKAKGDFIVMADSDGTYDLGSLPLFIKSLQNGADLVLGSRFKGKIGKGAMPLARRYFGNPALTAILNLFYNARLTDSQTGFRAFTKKAYLKLKMKGIGMEFASEMIIKAIFHRFTITEVPVNYNRRSGISKLSPAKDAIRHIKIMLLYSPTYTFLIPGLFLFVTGLAVSIALLPTPRIHSLTLTLLFASLGLQMILLGIFSRTYSQDILGLPAGPLARIFLRHFPPTRLFLLGLILILLGLAFILFITFSWASTGFATLSRLREVIFAVGICVLAAQLIFSSFLLSLMKEEI